MKPTTEIWKPIPAFEGLYEASSSGRIRSLDRITAVLPIIERQVRAAWAKEIRAIEVPAHNLHDQLPSDHWYAGQQIMRDEIAALLEGGDNQ